MGRNVIPPDQRRTSCESTAVRAATDTRAERVAREDMVLFVNACFASTSQAEFHSAAGANGVSLGFLHEYILGNYRTLYARVLAAGVNHENQARIVRNLLATGKRTPPSRRHEEGELLYAALRTLPTHRAYRLLDALRADRVNNRRARALVRRFLRERIDIAFEAVKYRKKMRAVASHAHVDVARMHEELGAFLYRRKLIRSFSTPIFEAYRAASFADASLSALPYTVAEGMAARKMLSREELLDRAKGQLTQGESLRLQRAAARAGRRIAIDLGKVGITRLALYLLGLPVDERLTERARFDEALDAAAKRVLRRTPAKLGRVAAVLDRSYSSSGSSEKRRRPLAVAWGASRILRWASREYRAFWTPAVEDEFCLVPHGQTDLATPLLDALAWGPDLVVIVSDGYENAPPSGAAEVARVFRERLDPERRTTVVHLNPVFDAEHFEPKALGAPIATVGVRDAEDLLTMLGFARFADGGASLAELEQFLSRRVDAFLRHRPPIRQDRSRVPRTASEGKTP
jgi:hypothetical protein